MKMLMTIGVLGVLLVRSVAALAASDASPAIVQPVLPADTQCSLSAGSSVIDYGSQTRGQLQAAGNSQTLTLGKRMLILSIACPYARNMWLTLRGNVAANGDLLYGARGSVRIRIMDVLIDGHTVQLTSTTSSGVLEGGEASDLRLQPQKGFAATQNGQLVKGKTFNARIEVEPVFPESATRVSTLQRDEASLTLELMK